MSVQSPPKMEANESGMSSFDGFNPRDAASEIMMGMKTTTTGVLLMKAESTATIGSITMRSDQSLFPTARLSRCAMVSITPVRSSAALRMNMQATVMAASLLKTLNASAGVKMPAASSALSASIATMSSDNFSQTIIAKVTASSPKTKSISQVMRVRVGSRHLATAKPL